ncbi:hypothetical protein Nepgr_019066 [Nepenthes gracilis]|uniref:Uncharacterized protein n=1 Tax=Nepenthes gracilis TaxID=150966 RepID=A0AAD3SSV0_NEPGR|nr:hypothetical protein Nepgr_019066 [Nepenthes gracilis]
MNFLFGESVYPQLKSPHTVNGIQVRKMKFNCQTYRVLKRSVKTYRFKAGKQRGYLVRAISTVIILLALFLEESFSMDVLAGGHRKHQPVGARLPPCLWIVF